VSGSGYEEARLRLREKDRSARDKLIPAAEAAALVRDGDVLAVGGCLYSRSPLALLREILRRRPRGLTLCRNLMCYEGDLFMAAGAVARVVTSWMGVGLPWGVSRVMRHHVESGAVAFEEWSHLALGLRLRAAAMGVPFLPTRSMLGSDLMRTSGATTMTCPFTGELLCLVPALAPDVAVLHVHRADRLGNAQIDGYPHMDADLALAARTVIVSAERIVDTDQIRGRGDRTAVPFFAVDAVVEARFGAYPHECWGLYDADMEEIGAYASAVAERGPAAAEEYLGRWVDGPATHADYLALFGETRLAERERAMQRMLA
jgi:glutaconate CoA-transferase subunit A